MDTKRTARPRRVLSVNEVARELGVSISTVHNFLKEGRLRGIRTNVTGNRFAWLITVDALEEFLAGGDDPQTSAKGGRK